MLKGKAVAVFSECLHPNEGQNAIIMASAWFALGSVESQ